LRHREHRLGEIDAEHMPARADPLGQRQRRARQPATDLEHTLTRLGRGAGQQQIVHAAEPGLHPRPELHPFRP
jgi:hypothetical protein